MKRALHFSVFDTPYDTLTCFRMCNAERTPWVVLQMLLVVSVAHKYGWDAFQSATATEEELFHTFSLCFLTQVAATTCAVESLYRVGRKLVLIIKLHAM